IKSGRKSETSKPKEESDVSVPISTDVPYIKNGIIIFGTKAMEQYFGSEDSGIKYSETLKKFKNDLGDSIKVYSLVAPQSAMYYSVPPLDAGKKRGEINFKNLKDHCDKSIIEVDVYNELKKHLDEPLYPRTEHHWNALGAYYAARLFSEKANVPFKDLSTYTKKVQQGFVGSLYTFSKAEILNQNPEEFVFYEPSVSCKALFYEDDMMSKIYFKRDSVLFDLSNSKNGKYATFLSGDYAKPIKVTTNANTGRTLVVYKDSFGNALAPFLLDGFDTIYFIDIRYFSKNGVKFAKDVGATDALFAVSAYTATGSVYKNIERIRTAK
ncbi:MAG: DHHW family protein, partial [Clostridia bacterium]